MAAISSPSYRNCNRGSCTGLASVREFCAENGHLMRSTECSRCASVCTELVATPEQLQIQRRRKKAKEEWEQRIVAVLEGED